MNFPLGLYDTSLLLATMATILLATIELLSPYNGRISIQINRKHLKNAALATSMLFLATATIEIVMIIIGLR